MAVKFRHSKYRVYLSTAAVFDLPLKVTVCPIPLKVDERETEGYSKNRKEVVREGGTTLTATIPSIRSDWSAIQNAIQIKLAGDITVPMCNLFHLIVCVI